MKNLKLVIVFISVAILFSCSNSSDNDLGLSGEGTLTAKVAGKEWKSLKSTVSATVTNKVAAIQGSTSNGEFIRINIANYNGVGTYKTGDAISNTNSISFGTITPVASWTSTFNIGSGTIKITEETSTIISGTFSFTGYNGSTNKKDVTNGVFSAPKK